MDSSGTLKHRERAKQASGTPLVAGLGKSLNDLAVQEREGAHEDHATMLPSWNVQRAYI